LKNSFKKEKSIKLLLSLTITKNNFWNTITKYPAMKYSHIKLDSLATVGIYKLNQNNVETSFENIAVILQKLFPDKFSLTYFPEYPDSLRVDNTLRLDCKHSGFVNGSRKEGRYVLTGKGNENAEVTINQINLGIKSKKSSNEYGRNKYVKLIQGVTKTDGYIKFIDNELESIKKFDVCETLHCTIDVDNKSLRDNYDLLFSHAEKIKNIENFNNLSLSVIKYLKFIEINWDRLTK